MVLLRAAWRLAGLLRLLLAYAAGLLSDRLRPPPRRLGGPDRFRRLLERAGGTFLKYGQVLALQPDILPRAYCNALFDLLDRVPPFPYHEVEQVFQEELGQGPDEIFDRLNITPLASASIGQVHVAELAGQRYAVKVRRPGVERLFATDLLIMRGVAFLIRHLRLSRLYWLDRGIREFDSWTWEELDYRYEARFMAALSYNARNNRHEAVPRVNEQLSTARILVAELLDGPMVIEQIRALEHGADTALSERLRRLSFDPECFARHIVENFVSDAFQHGLFHADLHPANLLVLDQNVVGYVDFGITGSLSHYSRRHLVALTLALTRGDADAILFYFLRIATTDPGADLPAFRRGLRELVDDWYGGPEGEEQCLRSSFTRVMLDMLHLSRRTGVWPTPDVIRYIRSVITADGLITRFAPQLDVGLYLEQVCEQYLRQEMWQRWLSAESMADWCSAGLRLLEHGPAALAAAVTGLGQGSREQGSREQDSDRTVTDGGAQPGAAAARRLLQLGLVALAAALLSVVEPPRLGLNLFTAELAVSLTAATMVVRAVLQLR